MQSQLSYSGRDSEGEDGNICKMAMPHPRQLRAASEDAPYFVRELACSRPPIQPLYQTCSALANRVRRRLSCVYLYPLTSQADGRWASSPIGVADIYYTCRLHPLCSPVRDAPWLHGVRRQSSWVNVDNCSTLFQEYFGSSFPLSSAKAHFSARCRSRSSRMAFRRRVKSPVREPIRSVYIVGVPQNESRSDTCCQVQSRPRQELRVT